MSLVDERDVLKDRARSENSGGIVGSFNTTDGYSFGDVQPVEIQVIFPGFSSRASAREELMKQYVQEYGKERAGALLSLADKVYFANIQGGRHPIIPAHMVLDKLYSHTDETGKRVNVYVPHELRDIYNAEIAQTRP